MSRLTSQHFVDRTSQLLREHSGGDISLSMVLNACGAQKGSLYYFFPGGKDELLAAAVENMRQCAMTHIQKCMEESQSTVEGIQKHLHFVAKLVDSPESELGMPFLAMAATIGENSTSVRAVCEKALKWFESYFASQLVKEGYSNKEAKNLATMTMISIEGAILLARVRGNSSPIKLAAAQLGDLIS